MAQPMVGGIYTADPETLSLRATLPRFLDMEREHRSLILAMLRKARTQDRAEKTGTSGARYSLFLSFDRGMEVLVKALEQKLKQPLATPDAQVDLRVNTRVQSLSWTGASLTTLPAAGSPITPLRPIAGVVNVTDGPVSVAPRPDNTGVL